MKKQIQMMVLVAIVVLCGIVAFATTYDQTVGGYAMPANAGRTYVVENSVDFATDNAAANDVFNMLLVPSNSIVHVVVYRIDSAVTNSGVAFAVGDNATATGYVDNVSAASAGTSVAAYWYTGTEKIYTTTNTINITMTNAATAGKISVKAMITDFNIP